MQDLIFKTILIVYCYIVKKLKHSQNTSVILHTGHSFDKAIWACMKPLFFIMRFVLATETLIDQPVTRP